MNTSNVLTIQQIFKERILRVPEYQRGYAWEVHQWNEFLEDLELLPHDKEHYTGTLVLHDKNSRGLQDRHGSRYAEYDVVDGQQRLTTIVLLLDAIRREMSSIDALKDLADGIQNTYLAAKDRANQPLYKLQLNDDLHRFFVRHVLADSPATGSAEMLAQQRLLDARRHFAKYLLNKRKKLELRFEDWLCKLHDKITQQLKLSLYTVSDSAEVGVVFEVMNNRGKPLAEMEKVKNYLLYLSTKLDFPGDVLREEVNQSWSKIFTNLMSAELGGDHEDRLLRVHWLMYQNPDRRKWQRTASIKERFHLRDYQGKHEALLEGLLRYTRTLRDASLAYRDIYRPQNANAFKEMGNANVRKGIKDWCERLRRLDALTPFLPLLIAARLRLSEDGAAYLQLVRLCEVFAFRVYRLLEYRSHTGQSSLFLMAYKYYHQKINFDELMSQLTGLLLFYYAPDAKFAAALQRQTGMQENKNDWYNRSITRYFLYEYETHRSGREVVRLPWEAVAQGELAKTIEHILPQTATDIYWTNLFSEEQRKSLVHDIGNLCLTSHNGALGNKPFLEKRGVSGSKSPCYASSIIRIEQDLARYPEWTPDTILARRKELVTWAMERWSIGNTPAVQPEIVEDHDDKTD